ncbi:MAG: glycosyltransferase family 2 protein [Candidatus Peregrinibacteria bacterium]
MPSLSIAIPAFNEEESLEPVVRRCIEILQQCSNDFEIVLLDDGSTDHTRAIIEQLASEYPKVILPCFHQRNEGMSSAFERVQRAATKEYVFLFHADGQYQPETIAACLPHLSSCDILLCRRMQKHYSLYRSIISGSYRLLCRLCFGIDLLDPGGAKVIRSALFPTIPVRSRSIFSQAERVIRAFRSGCRIHTMDVPCEPRRTGQAKGGTIRDASVALRDMLLLWWEFHRQKIAKPVESASR